MQRKSSSILLLFRGKGVLRLCRTTTAISSTIASPQDIQSFLTKKISGGVHPFKGKILRRFSSKTYVWSVRQLPSMNTSDYRSTGAYRLPGEVPRPLQNACTLTRCYQATPRAEQSGVSGVGARGFIPLTRWGLGGGPRATSGNPLFLI